jgi:hypothetical protein
VREVVGDLLQSRRAGRHSDEELAVKPLELKRSDASSISHPFVSLIRTDEVEDTRHSGPAQWAKSQRVAPWGSAVATPTAVCSVRR